MLFLKRLAAMALAAFITFLSVLTLGIDALSAGKRYPEVSKDNVLLIGAAERSQDITTDGKYYYAVVKKVPMFTNVNVTAMRETRRFRLKTERKILSAEWMDNGEKVEVTEDGDVIVAPFSYGYSYGIRIAKIILEEN